MGIVYVGYQPRYLIRVSYYIIWQFVPVFFGSLILRHPQLYKVGSRADHYEWSYGAPIIKVK